MSRDGALLVVLGVIVVGVLAVVGLGAGLGAYQTTVSTSSSPSTTAAIPDPPGDGSSGVVFSSRVQGGQSLFGIPLTSDEYILHVGMVAPENCVVADAEGMQALSEEGECAELPARGKVTGGGTNAAGDNLVIVELEVERDCFEALTEGDAWPSSAEACREDTSG